MHQSMGAMQHGHNLEYLQSLPRQELLTRKTAENSCAHDVCVVQVSGDSVWIDDGVLHPLLHKTRAGNNLRKLRWVRLVLLFEDTCPACYKSCCKLSQCSAMQFANCAVQYRQGACRDSACN